MNINNIVRSSNEEHKNLRILGEDNVVKRALEVTTNLFSAAIYPVSIYLVSNDSKSAQEALELIKKGEKFIIISSQANIEIHRNSAIVSQMLKYSNVEIIKGITGTTLVDIIKFSEKLKSSDEEVSLRVDESQNKISSRVLAILEHDLKDWVIKEKGESYHRIINEARNAFGIKGHVTDKEVEDFIKNTPREIKPVMSGEIPGVYCDIDDTILDKEEKIINSTLDLIQKLEKEGHVIHIWTGGDIDKAKERLKGTPFEKYKILSKYDHAGATAEIVIDNVSPEKFSIQTGISVKKFIRV